MSTRHERAADKSLNEKHSKILNDMLQRPENKRCADCRKKDPRWVSWNLGLFMCIRCSGVHRSLGTHISKVKSVDLDSWTPEQIANVVRWGNATANKYWEANLSVEPTEATIGQWIRAKYDRKQFAMSGPMPEPEALAGGSVGNTSQAQQATQPAPIQSSPDMLSHNSIQNNKPQSQQPLGAEFFTINKPPGSNSSSQFNGFQAQAQTQASPSFFQNPAQSSHGQNQQPPQQAPQQTPQNSFKMDIMSLYSTPGPSSPNRTQFPGSIPGQPQTSFQGMNKNTYGGSINQQQNQQPQQALPQGGQYFSNFPSYPPPSQPQSQYGAYATGNPSYGPGMSGMMMNSSTPANASINSGLGMPTSSGAAGPGGGNLPSQLQSNPWANFGTAPAVNSNPGGFNATGGASGPKSAYDPFGN